MYYAHFYRVSLGILWTKDVLLQHSKQSHGACWNRSVIRQSEHSDTVLTFSNEDYVTDVVKYYFDDKTKNYNMGGECSKHGNETCVQNCRPNTISETHE